MDAQSVASMQKQLRSAYDNKDYGPSVVKHMQKVEDFSSEPTQREAFRKARSMGHLKFLYNGTIFGTRLKTESRQEHVTDMLERAKSAAGPEVIGMPGEEAPLAGMPDDLGGELPMAESKKINIKQLDKFIIQEMKKVKGRGAKRMLFENWKKALRKRLAKKHKCKPPTEKNFRMRRANYRRFKQEYKLKQGQWPPGDSFSAFAVKDSNGKIDDNASFRKFYAAVQEDKCAYIALGGLRKMRPIGKYPFDFKFGDQHSDAYSQLNPGTRATGGVEIDDKAATELSSTANMPGYEEALAKLERYETYCRKSENECNETDFKKMEALRKDIEKLKGVEGGSRVSPSNRMRFFDDELAYNIASYEKYSRMGEKNRDKIIDLLSRLKAAETALANIEARRKVHAAEKYDGGKRAPSGAGPAVRSQWLQKRKEWQLTHREKTRELTASFDSHQGLRDRLGKELARLRRPGELAQRRAGMAKDIEARRSLARKKLAKAKELNKKLRGYYNTVRSKAPKDRLGAYSKPTQKVIDELGQKIRGLNDAMNDLRNNQDVDISRFEHP